MLSTSDEELIAEAASWLNKRNLAFEGLQLLAERDLAEARRVVFVPAFRNLHDDPRWDEWRESIGMSAERLDAIEFNPDLPD